MVLVDWQDGHGANPDWLGLRDDDTRASMHRQPEIVTSKTWMG